MRDKKRPATPATSKKNAPGTTTLRMSALFERQKQKALNRALEESVERRVGLMGANIDFDVTASLDGVVKTVGFSLCDVELHNSFLADDDMCVMGYVLKARRRKRG